MFIPNAKQSRAAKMLDDAQLYLLDVDRLRTIARERGCKPSQVMESERLAFDILMDAERFVKCGFRMPASWMEFLGVSDSLTGRHCGQCAPIEIGREP